MSEAEGKQMEPFTFTAEPASIISLRELSVKRERSISFLIRKAIQEYLQRQGVRTHG